MQPHATAKPSCDQQAVLSDHHGPGLATVTCDGMGKPRCTMELQNLPMMSFDVAISGPGTLDSDSKHSLSIQAFVHSGKSSLWNKCIAHNIMIKNTSWWLSENGGAPKLWNSQDLHIILFSCWRVTLLVISKYEVLTPCFSGIAINNSLPSA